MARHATRFAVHLPALSPVGPNSERRAHVVSGGRSLLTPTRVNDSIDRREKVEAIIDFLNVETSPRYRPTNQATYCNVYAADFGALAGCYIPRVWWLRPADPLPTVVEYGVNVREMRANDLFEWFDTWGPRFDWVQEHRISALQQCAEEGGVGCIVARHSNPERSGHISIVVPQGQVKPLIRDGDMAAPVQSCAGRKNQSRFAADWWTSAAFSGFSFWSHE